MPAVDVVVYAASAGPFYGGQGLPGGAELQSYYIARALASVGFRVRHVVADAEISRTSEGVEVVRIPPQYAQRGLPRRVAILQALHRADGRLYIQRTAGIETGFAGVYARLAGRRFVFSSSSDSEFVRDIDLHRQLGGGLDSWSKRTQAWIGMRCAHAVVVQTEQQADFARNSFGLRPRIIRSFCEPGAGQPDGRDVFLWVGGYIGIKDPHSLLDLAERVPDGQFVMVAREPVGWEALAASVRGRAAGLPNVDVLPPRPRDELLVLYERALAVVNTSMAEGFSNVFLEGWARGVPTLSLRVDPDGVIARRGLGGVAGGSIEELARMSRRYLDDPTAADVAGAAAHRYVQETHAPEVVGAMWAELVEELLRN